MLLLADIKRQRKVNKLKVKYNMLHIKKIRPLFTNLLTTGNKYDKDEKQRGLIIAKKGDLKLYQTVLAVGSMVRDIKVGDKIMINPKDYVVTKYDPNSVKDDMGLNKIVRFNMPWVDVDDENGNSQECLLLKDRDVEYVFEGVEEDEPDSPLTESPLILPKSQNLTVN